MKSSESVIITRAQILYIKAVIIIISEEGGGVEGNDDYDGTDCYYYYHSIERRGIFTFSKVLSD